MPNESFAERCQRIFELAHGRRWKTACSAALGISRASLYRYLDGKYEPAADVLGALRLLENAGEPVRTDEEMARLMALALVRLRRDLDQDGWLKPPYKSDVQRFLDLSAARNAADGTSIWPSTIGSLVQKGAMRLSAWMPDTARWDESAAFTEEPLLDGEDTSITCRELAAEIEGHSPEDELVEAAGFATFRTSCRAHADGQISYATWRRFVVENPVVRSWGAAMVQTPMLAAVSGLEDAFHAFYEPLTPAFAIAGRVPICRVSGTVLRRDGAIYQTDSREPEAVRLARSGICDFIDWSPSTRVLRRPFRTFWCFPGKAEVALMDRLAQLGWTIDPWPQLDMVDLEVASPDGSRKIAIDVKDYGSPALLASRFDGFKGYERTHECVLVVPDAQIEADRNYASIFSNLRSSFGKKPVKLRTVSRLINELGRPE